MSSQAPLSGITFWLSMVSLGTITVPVMVTGEWNRDQRPDDAQRYLDFSWFKPVFVRSCFSKFLDPLPSCLTSIEILFPQWWGRLSLSSGNPDLFLCVPWCLGPSLSYLTNTRLSSSDEGHHGLPLISGATSSPSQEGVTLWIEKTKQTKLIHQYLPFCIFRHRGEVGLFLFIKIISTGNKGNSH